ncbi:restriction endonuclease subunit S [Bifidobacterium cebidarum]|uniref:Type I restriction endonuclease subunit S n=1 Tax=Bifidobacterium cebidarum TaxID=2650773 RepID=A0A6I1GG27_9BIFI|nr:restriction endonuclease subunit S [Bifidobacterium cebidarum]KAB7788477.1 type I restriction endonuclease subunit S [Bifidobacterium cebidarum]
MGCNQIVPLRDCISLVIDYRGKTPKKLGQEWSSSGYRALSARNIKTGQIVQAENIHYGDSDLYHAWMKDEVQRGDILITSEAPFGQIYRWNSDEKIILSQRLFTVRPNSEICDSRYLYYWMCNSSFQEELKNRATGTTVVGLRQPELLKCSVVLPVMEIQLRIAELLGTIDAEITNLNQTNGHLYERFELAA